MRIMWNKLSPLPERTKALEQAYRWEEKKKAIKLL